MAEAKFRFRDRATQAAYEAWLARGVPAPRARRLALRSPIIPAMLLRTETAMFAAHRTLAEQFAGVEDQLEHVTSVAERHGYRPSPNDVYMPSLATFPGDPAGFVKQGEAESHARRLGARRGHDCQRPDGSYIYRERYREPAKPPRLAEDIVEHIAAERMAKDPDLAHRDQRKLREEIIEAHGAKE